MATKYYDVKTLINRVPDAHYYIVIGERSNGKTYSILNHCLEDYFKYGHEFVYIRRFDEDIKYSRGSQIFNALINNKVIEKLSHGEWNDVYYYARKWYFRKLDPKNPKNTIISDVPFAYAISLTSEEHDKSTSYPKVKNIFFEEFLSRDNYLTDEFMIFENTLSTIIRLRNDVKIFMAGNTINKYTPYFNEMGLTNVKNMQVGATEIYTYGDSGLKVAVEFSVLPSKNKESNVYFAFDNPKLSMIRGDGGIWEIDIYPHLTKDMKYKPKDIIYKYYVIWDNDILQCDIVRLDDLAFTFVHRKSSPIKEDNTNIVYSTEHNSKPNYKRRIIKATNHVEEIILWFYKNEKVFYQSNEIGEIMRNYILWCKKTPIEY
ncbi:MAG: phage DNA encapsidation protein [Methanobrevibacter sp.]|nr:phage DNA encapsidation protein [Methanobrevibacter sp.]